MGYLCVFFFLFTLWGRLKDQGAICEKPWLYQFEPSENSAPLKSNIQIRKGQLFFSLTQRGRYLLSLLLFNPLSNEIKKHYVQDKLVPEYFFHNCNIAVAQQETVFHSVFS